jgi:hypothetical protein
MYLKICLRVIPYTRAIETSFLSVCENPDDTAVIITGSAIRTAAKTGTNDEPNQKTAISMNETTGVERITAIGSLIKVRKNPENPQQKPITVPKTNVMMNEANTRRAVAPT